MTGRSKGLGAVVPPRTAPTKMDFASARLDEGSKGLFVDLIEATRKSFAAGLGEWDLQAVESGHPQFKERLLKGPLGPESLKNHYGLSELDQLKLYRVLYSYTVGFCDAVDEPTAHALRREELLEMVFKTYAQLWDEALGVAFSSEMVSAYHAKSSALALVEGLRGQLDSAQSEISQLQQRLNQFAKGSIDSMLVQRMDTDKARTTEGEVHMLAKAADTLSLKLAGTEAAQEGLVLAAQEAHHRMEAAEDKSRELMRQTAKLKDALKEQQNVGTRLASKVKELSTQLSSTTKENGRLSAELKVHQARVTPVERPRSELELILADKTRAFSLLHTDFVVKMAELDEFRHQNRELREKVQEMHATFDSASQRIMQAQTEKDRFKRKWESNCMYTADLEATNSRLSLRNHELVRAYWPLMSHLREVEARCEEVEVEQRKALSDKARLVEQVTTQQEQLQRAALYKQRMRGLEATLAAAEAAGEVPQYLLAELCPESAERLRAFVRGANMRVESLTTQLVHLVDVHASSSADLQQYRVLNRELHRQVKALDEQNKELEAHFMRQVMRVSAQAANEVAEELAALQHEDERMSRSQAQEEKAGAPATPVSYMAKIASLRLEMQELEERMDLVQRVRTVNENRIAVLEDERDAALSECAGRDKWLYEVCNQAEALAEQVIRLLARDSSAPPPTSRFKPGSALDPQSPPSAAPNSQSPSTQQQQQGGNQKAGKVPQQEHGSRVVMLGRLAVRVGVSSETCRPLVAVDRCWESMAAAVERMVQWGSGLVTNPAQISQMQQLKAQAATSAAAKQQDQAEIQALTTRAEEAEKQLHAATQRLQALEEQLASITSASETAQSGRAAFESALNAARQELEQLHAKHTRMEREYWAVKAQLLDAELKGGEAGAARDRAQADSQRAAERMQRAEKETADHRHQRKQLEADVVGLKAWIRTMQGTEHAYRGLLLELGQSQDRVEAAEKASAARQNRMSTQASQLEAAQHQVSVLAAQLKESATHFLDERRGGAAADHAVRTAAAAQVASAEEARGLADRRALEAEDSHRAATARLSRTEAQLTSLESEGSSLRQQLFASQQQVARLQALLPQLSSGTQAIERMAANMEHRIGSLSARLAHSSIGGPTDTAAGAASPTPPTTASAGSGSQHGSLLTACNALADCAEGMAESIASSLMSADSHCGVQQQIEVLVRMEGLVNDLMALLNSSSPPNSSTTTQPLTTSTTATPKSPAAAPSTPTASHSSPPRSRKPAPSAPSSKGPPGASWSAPAGKEEVEGAEEQPTLAASVVALQTSLAHAREEAARAAEAERAQRSVCITLERELASVKADVRQQGAEIEHLRVKVQDSTHLVASARAERDAAVIAQKAAEETVAVAAAQRARAERERDDAVEHDKAASAALDTERSAVLRLQRMCAEATSVSLQAGSQGARALGDAGREAQGGAAGSDQQAGLDVLLQLSSARTECADAMARLELAESVSKAAVADAQAARAAAAQSAETARKAEVARLEITSLLAEARRAQEAVQDMVRHAEAEAARARECTAEAERNALQERERGDAMARALLDIQVEMRLREGERALALSALVDESVEPSVGAAVAAAAQNAVAIASTGQS